MPFYKKKPIVIEAIQYTGSNDQEIIDFAAGAVYQKGIPYSPSAPDRDRGPFLFCKTLETLPGAEGHYVSVNDFIIKGVKGEFYPCKPDIFALTYEEA